MRGNKIIFAVLVLAGLGELRAETTQPALKGTLTAVIEAKGEITRVAAVDREWADVLKVSQSAAKDKFVYEAKYDAQTGKVTVADLLPGRTYDLIVWAKDAQGNVVRYEGVNMEYHRDINPSDKPATDEDRKWIETFVRDTPNFHDRCRVLWIAADSKYATACVELIRTREFYADKGGEIIYRVELWYFENYFGGWAKDKNTEKVMTRVRGKPAQLEMYRQYLPALGGIALDRMTGTNGELKIKLPEPPDPRRGLVGKVPEKIEPKTDEEKPK